MVLTAGSPPSPASPALLPVPQFSDSLLGLGPAQGTHHPACALLLQAAAPPGHLCRAGTPTAWEVEVEFGALVLLPPHG